MPTYPAIVFCVVALLLTAGSTSAQTTETVTAADTPSADEESVPPEQVRCVNLRSIRSTRVLDDKTIVFEMGGKKKLVNRLARRCPSLGFEKSFGYKTRMSQLCKGDIITVVTDIGPGASCGLGMFETWIEPEEVVAPADAGRLEPVEPAS